MQALKVFLLIAALILTVGLSCAWSTGNLPKNANDYIAEYGGDANVYIRILTSVDCEELQKEFDLASANNQTRVAGTKEFKWTLGYMTAVNDQMEALSCYK